MPAQRVERRPARREHAVQLGARNCRLAGQVCGPQTDVHVDQLRVRGERHPHAEVRHVDLGPHGPCKRVDRGGAAEKTADHLGGDLGRIRAHAVGGDAVIPGRDEDRAALEVMGRNSAGDRAQLHGERLDAAQTAARFGQLIDALARGACRRGIAGLDHAAVPAPAVSLIAVSSQPAANEPRARKIAAGANLMSLGPALVRLRTMPCITPAWLTISARSAGAMRDVVARKNRIDARTERIPRFAALGGVVHRRLFVFRVQLRPAGDDLLPRQPLPLAEVHLAQLRGQFDREVARSADRLRRHARADQVAGKGEIETLLAQVQGEGLRLRQALVVERDVGLALEAPAGVPRRAPVPDADQFHPGYFLMNGRPSCATSRSCMSLACSSSIARMPSSIVRVVESLVPK